VLPACTLVLTGTFLDVEVVAGILTGSLALISDAAHMLTDTAALGRSGGRCGDWIVGAAANVATPSMPWIDRSQRFNNSALGNGAATAMADDTVEFAT